MILVVLFFIFIAGCNAERELTVAVGGAPSEIEVWKEIIEEFERETRIKVKIIRQASDTDLRRQHLIMSLMSKNEDPDLFLMDVAWLVQFIDSGWLLPLEGGAKGFMKGALNVAKRKGKLYALPVNIDCALLYYRRDLIDKYNCKVPETWEELKDCALRIMDKEKREEKPFYGFIWQGAQYEGLVCVFAEFITSHGGNFEDIYSDRNIKALNFMRDLIHKYRISPPDTYTSMKEEEVRLIFQSGFALFERNWPYAYRLHNSEDSKVKGKVGVTLIPRSEGGRHASCLGGWYIGISSYSDRKREAIKLLRFITSYETQKKFVLKLGWNSAREDVMREMIKREEHLEIVRKSCEYAVARPLKPYYSLVSSVLQRYINSAISGKMEPEEALRRAEAEIERIKEYYEGEE